MWHLPVQSQQEHCSDKIGLTFNSFEFRKY